MYHSNIQSIDKRGNVVNNRATHATRTEAYDRVKVARDKKGAAAKRTCIYYANRQYTVSL